MSLLAQMQSLLYVRVKSMMTPLEFSFSRYEWIFFFLLLFSQMFVTVKKKLWNLAVLKMVARDFFKTGPSVVLSGLIV